MNRRAPHEEALFAYRTYKGPWTDRQVLRLEEVPPVEIRYLDEAGPNKRCFSVYSYIRVKTVIRYDSRWIDVVGVLCIDTQTVMLASWSYHGFDQSEPFTKVPMHILHEALLTEKYGERK